ncbi:MAG: hypothetical protein ACFB4I_01700 [Cyanophyceae cyanobacterium]
MVLVEKGAQAGRVAVVNVAHEALIRRWHLLKQWLDENRVWLSEQRRIEAAAHEWRTARSNNPRKASDYLLQGSRLQQAREFQKEHQETFRSII